MMTIEEWAANPVHALIKRAAVGERQAFADLAAASFASGREGYRPRTEATLLAIALQRMACFHGEGRDALMMGHYLADRARQDCKGESALDVTAEAIAWFERAANLGEESAATLISNMPATDRSVEQLALAIAIEKLL